MSSFGKGISIFKPLAPGDTFHWLRSGISYSIDPGASFGGRISQRGQEVVVDLALIAGSLDKNGRSWLDMVDSPAAQSDRWGQPAPAFARGPWPEGESVWIRGSAEAEAERARRLHRAGGLVDEVERGAELRRIKEEFGPLPTNGQQLADYRGDNENPLRVAQRRAF
jgi:hypothetical protein